MIESKRTYLRPVETHDSAEIFAYRSDAVTNKFQGWIPKTISDVDEFIAKIPSHFNLPGTWFQLAIVEQNENKIIGDIGIHFIDEMQCEIGFTVAKNYQGKGYASESVSAVINHLFNELNKHRITASVDPENINSIRLLEKLGFRKEAHFIKSLFINGEWVDDVVYAVLKNEWN